MKFITKITLLIILYTTYSCQPLYYQVYKTKSNDNIDIKNDIMVYEDLNCTVVYDLWANKGNFSFKFFNKTNDNLYIHLDESFYVKNGMAYNYFNNRIFSKSVTQIVNAYDALNINKLSRTNNVGVLNRFGVSNTFTSTEINSSSTTQIEEKIMIIPKKSAKIIYGFYINSNLLSFPELIKSPKKKEKSNIQFTKENSPLTFSNLISYSLNKDDKLIKIDNEFYVSELTNYLSEELIEIINKDANGKFIRPHRYLKDSGPNKFYIKY